MNWEFIGRNIMTTLSNKITAAKTLEEVCELLNSFEIDANDDQDRLDHHVDICELPTFGKEPSDTTEIFSWNETHCLIQNTCTGPAFEIVLRNDLEITDIQLYDYAFNRQINEGGDHEVVYSYSANLIINDSFVVQVSGDHNQATFDGVTSADVCFWNNEEAQENAYENIDDSELKKMLEEEDLFANSIEWLNDNATETMNPGNAQYRFDNSDTRND
jgi:hypothetical protein